MSNFTIPYTFVGGTKARAEEVNANFVSVKNELNIKAEKNDDGTVVVADATEPNHAINKSQAETIISNALTSKVNCNLSNLSEEGLQKLQQVPFSFSYGNVSLTGEPDLLYISANNTTSNLSFKVGANLGEQFPKLKGVYANGVEFERDSISDLNFSALADGIYNLFLSDTGECVPLKNKIFFQKNEPQTVIENSWTQPVLTANGTLGGNSFAVSASREYSGHAIWKAFDSDVSSQYWSSGTGTYPVVDIIFYNPVPLKVSSIVTSNAANNNEVIKSGSIYGSNDGTNWELIAEYNTTTVSNKGISISVNSDNSYLYHKIANATTQSGYSVSIGNIVITATEYISGAKINDVWLNTAVRPYVSKIYNGSDWIDYNYVPLPQTVTIGNGLIASINKSGNFYRNGWDEFVILPDINKVTSLTSGIAYTASVNGWVGDSSGLKKPLFVGETFIPDASGYKFYAMKGV